MLVTVLLVVVLIETSHMIQPAPSRLSDPHSCQTHHSCQQHLQCRYLLYENHLIAC